MKKTLTIVLSVCMFFLALSACAGEKDGKIRVRVNEVTHSIFYAPQYLAMAMGYFDDEGLSIELVNGGGADKSMTAIVAGAADIGLMGPEAAVYVYAQGKTDYPIIFGQLTKRDGSFLVGRTEDKDFDYSKLTNKHIISGRRGGMPAMTFEYVLNNNGLIDGQNVTLDDSVAFNLMGPAFEGNKGDYVTLFEPVASDMQAAGKGYIVASIGADSGEVPYTAYMAKKTFLENKPDVAEKFLRAVYRAMVQIHEMTAEEIAEKILVYFDGSTLESIVGAVKSYQDIDAWMDIPVMKESSFSRMLDIMQNAGELSERVPFDKLIDNTIAERVVQQLAESES